jgi:hypothetical protein
MVRAVMGLAACTLLAAPAAAMGPDDPFTPRAACGWRPRAPRCACPRRSTATIVSACQFAYTAPGALGRSGVVSMWLRFTRQATGAGFSESVESLAEFSVKEPA